VEGPGPGQLGLPEQLRRERLVDMERRLAQYRRSAFGVLGLALLASVPSLGWLWLIPLSATVAIFLVTDRLVQASAHAARWAALGWAISPLTIALSVALTGGPESPATAPRGRARPADRPAEPRRAVAALRRARAAPGADRVPDRRPRSFQGHQ
jgi:hypothetical protein